jgi:ABC-type polysaccharide/polyol phosphate export permease
MLAWFFLTPIFYPLEFLGAPLHIAGYTLNPAVMMRWLNPMASLVDGYRTVLWGIHPHTTGPAAMDPAYLLRTFVTAVIILIVGYVVFIRAEHLFGEKL